MKLGTNCCALSNRQSSFSDNLTINATVALAGQPNTGKSTIFNGLTGSHQHVGNWPGKTIAKKEGFFKMKETDFRLIDLPGSYSLSASSAEEALTRDYLLSKELDLVVVVVDAAQLSRSLYMAVEIMELGLPLLLAVNMMDVATIKGTDVDCNELAKMLGVPVIGLSANTKDGLMCLKDGIARHCAKLPEQKDYNLPEEMIETANIKEKISHYPLDMPNDWVVGKVIEYDSYIDAKLEEVMSETEYSELQESLGKANIDSSKPGSHRFQFIHKVVEKVSTGKNKFGRNRFDKYATHPITGTLLGLFITICGFVGAMLLAYFFVDFLYTPTNWLIEETRILLTPISPVFASFLGQGLLPSIYMVTSLSVFIFCMLFFTGLFENIGYLSRMAYISDIFMQRFGLHGKSFLPLFMGFGCNIAGILGCRVIDIARQRFKTIVIASHVPCPGVMVTVAFFIAIFFGGLAPFILLAVFCSIIIQLLITSKILDHTVLKGVHRGMMMELPPYHRPNWLVIFKFVWRNYTTFLKKAGSLMITMLTIVWALSYFPGSNMNESYLAMIGKIIEPAGMLMGMDWRLLTCLLVAMFSKEAAIIALAVIYGIDSTDMSLVGIMMGDNSGRTSNIALQQVLAISIQPASALAFIFATVFSIPCYATVATIYYETKSLQWTAGICVYYFFITFLWGALAYQVGLILL